MSNTLTGKVHKLLEFESGQGAKGEWRKLPFVIETTDKYPKKVCFEAWAKVCDHAENLRPGQEVTVHYNLESREFNNKWFTSARAWKIEVLSGSISTDSGSVVASTANADESEDLPF